MEEDPEVAVRVAVDGLRAYFQLRPRLSWVVTWFADPPWELSPVLPRLIRGEFRLSPSKQRCARR